MWFKRKTIEQRIEKRIRKMVVTRGADATSRPELLKKVLEQPREASDGEQ